MAFKVNHIILIVKLHKQTLNIVFEGVFSDFEFVRLISERIMNTKIINERQVR